jgi:hypothetical protein
MMLSRAIFSFRYTTKYKFVYLNQNSEFWEHFYGQPRCFFVCVRQQRIIRMLNEMRYLRHIHVFSQCSLTLTEAYLVSSKWLDSELVTVPLLMTCNSSGLCRRAVKFISEERSASVFRVQQLWEAKISLLLHLDVLIFAGNFSLFIIHE